nr:T9SS type A sorting domain-containing protein [Bacteroidota bacterium]
MKQKFTHLFTVLMMFAFVANVTAQKVGENSPKDEIFYEDFSDGGFDIWTATGEGVDNWTEEASNLAGGEAPEVYMSPQPEFSGQTRLISPVINTSGYSMLSMTFLHLLESNNPDGYYIRVATTSDGGDTWNQVWELYWDEAYDYSGSSELLAINTPDVGSENFQFCFQFEGSSSYNMDGWSIDNISLGDPQQYDVGTLNISGLEDVMIENDDVLVSATVFNYGSETVTFDVTLEINDGTNVVFESTETVTGLSFGSVEQIDFETWTAFEGDNLVATVSTTLSGDMNPDNDQLDKLFVVFPEEYYCLPSAFCDWGTLFADFAFAGIENYGSGCSPNGYGYFSSQMAYVEIGNTYTASMSTEFYGVNASIWIDFDKDFVFEEDELVLTDFVLEEELVMIDVDIQIPGFAEAGTTTMRIGVCYTANSSDDPCATFTYGEWEDYSIEISGGAISLDAAVISIDLDSYLPSGDITPYATVKNYGDQVISFPVTMTVDGTSYSSTVEVTDLAINGEIQVEFETWNAPTAVYNVEVCTELAGDEVPGNDCMQTEITTMSYDVVVVEINLPTNIQLGDITPKATVESFAFETVTFPVTMTIGSYSSTVEVANLPAFAQTVVTFDTWTNTLGEHTIEVCTELATDENTDNDCMELPVTVSDGQRQKVVIELFTATWCTYCPYAELGVEELHEEFPNTLAVIAWHSTDDFAFPESEYRYDILCPISGLPSAVFDGLNQLIGGSPHSTYSYYLPEYEDRIITPSNFTIDMEITNTDATDYNVYASFEINEGFNQENLAAFVVLTESELPYPGLANQPFTARSQWPDSLGYALDFSTQTTQEINATITLEDDYVFENCEVVVFLQNMDTKEIYQGTSKMMTEIVGMNEVKAVEMEVYPNPATDRVTIKAGSSIEQLEILNHVGQRVYKTISNANILNIDISDLKAGIYLFKVSTVEGVEIKQLVVQ